MVSFLTGNIYRVDFDEDHEDENSTSEEEYDRDTVLDTPKAVTPAVTVKSGVGKSGRELDTTAKIDTVARPQTRIPHLHKQKSVKGKIL